MLKSRTAKKQKGSLKKNPKGSSITNASEPKKKSFKVIVTSIVSEHETLASAQRVLKALKPKQGALGVIIDTTEGETIYD